MKTAQVEAGTEGADPLSGSAGNARCRPCPWLRGWTKRGTFFLAPDRGIADDNATYLHSVLGSRAPSAVEAQYVGCATLLERGAAHNLSTDLFTAAGGSDNAITFDDLMYAVVSNQVWLGGGRLSSWPV
jgi:hypothetical protein